MLRDISLSTIGLSASLSVVTAYLGTLINFSRLRARHRRVFGLSLLAEIKSLQRLFRRYIHALEEAKVSSPSDWPKLHFSSADTSVFNNGAGNLGLFSTRTAVEVIEIYGAIRAVAVQAEDLAAPSPENEDNGRARHVAVAHHLQCIRLARHHGRAVVAALRREIPRTGPEAIRYGVRVAMIRLRRARRWMRPQYGRGKHAVAVAR